MLIGQRQTNEIIGGMIDEIKKVNTQLKLEINVLKTQIQNMK